MTPSAVAVIEQGAAVEVAWADAAPARFHAVWLRDNALDARTRSPVNGQRLITFADQPDSPCIGSASVQADGSLGVRFLADERTYTYPGGWLREHAYDRPAPAPAGWVQTGVECWDAGLVLPEPATHAALVADRSALRRWLQDFRRYGVGRMRDVAVRDGAVCDVAELFAHVRHTNYGRWFDVRSKVDAENLAYTTLGLQAHTDNPYREPVPALQFLACLENSVTGGESFVVDGFAIAQRLRDTDAAAFALLARYPARFEYAGQAGVRLRAKRPVIELGPDGELIAIRYNHRSMAPAADVPYPAMPAYYAALRLFARWLDAPAAAVRFQMQPGDLFVVDNTRVLHGRTQYAGTGHRWLQGCYADGDGLRSMLAAMEGEA